MNNPPALLKSVLDAVLILFGEKDISWGKAKKYLA